MGDGPATCAGLQSGQHDRCGVRGKKIKRSPLLLFALCLGYELKKTQKEIGGLELDELALQMAFFKNHDPHRQENWRAGMIASVIANYGGNHDATPEDFMLEPRADAGEAMDEKTIERNLRTYFAAKKGRL